MFVRAVQDPARRRIPGILGGPCAEGHYGLCFRRFRLFPEGPGPGGMTGEQPGFLGAQRGRAGEGEPRMAQHQLDSAVGEPAWVHGRVLTLAGAALDGAELDVWQNDANELYGVQDDDAPEAHLRGKFRTRADGSYAFLGVRPVPYRIPSDGPVGEMLAASGRHPWRPAHLHMIVSAPGYQTLTTHIFDADSAYLESDAVFAVKPSLLRRFVRRTADDPERPAAVTGDWWSVQNDIVLAPLRDSEP